MSGLEFQNFEPQNQAVPETVKCAALLWKGEIFTGVTHAHAFFSFAEAHPEIKNPRNERFEDGFETSIGRFITRNEALEIADRNEQIRGGTRVDKNFGLRSEDFN